MVVLLDSFERFQHCDVEVVAILSIIIFLGLGQELQEVALAGEQFVVLETWVLGPLHGHVLHIEVVDDLNLALI